MNGLKMELCTFEYSTHGISIRNFMSLIKIIIYAMVFVLSLLFLGRFFF